MKHKNIFCIWRGDKTLTLDNFKAPWKENGVKPQFFIRTNGAKWKNGDNCYSFTIAFGYLMFNYTNFNLQGRERKREVITRG